MTKLRVGLLVAAGALVVLILGAGTAFYLLIYKPIGSPMMAMSAGRTLEERRLRNHTIFVEPASGELTAEQAARFVAVEEAVQRQLTTAATVLAQKQAELEQAYETNGLSVRTTLDAFGAIKGPYLDAKVAQIDAMNQQDFSVTEFEWVRKQLYLAAGLAFSQLDVSEILDGNPDAGAGVRRFETDERIGTGNENLALPLADKLQAWRALAFFGL